MQISRVSFILIVSVLITVRLVTIKWDKPLVVSTLTWDSFGYYMFLPAVFVYDDLASLKWVEPVNEQYHVTGQYYQFSDLPNGNRVGKYFLGLAVMCLPFFLIAHILASILGFPADGFSTPYQLGIAGAALVYAFLGLWVLRKVLLRHFSDMVTGITLLLVALGTNYMQYVAIEGGMTHGFIFSLYVFLLYFCEKWHQSPGRFNGFMIGAMIGLGVLCRPTEIVMIFIPVFYWMQHRDASKEKWRLVSSHRSHILWAFAGGMMLILPQVIYWKYVTGHWVHDVGSKWVFFDPYWRVLFGCEKGWFVYTPVAVLMVLGLFRMKASPFYKSAIIYFLLNVWVVISWSDWQYGASFSTRALIQSYAVMSIPLAFTIAWFFERKLKWAAWVLAVVLTGMNLFQLWQYNVGIIHYNDMNCRYYREVFLNPNPSPTQMSLLDTDDFLSDTSDFTMCGSIREDSVFQLHGLLHPVDTLFIDMAEDSSSRIKRGVAWIHVSVLVKSDWGAFDSYIHVNAFSDGRDTSRRFRLYHTTHKDFDWQPVAFYFQTNNPDQRENWLLWAETKSEQHIYLKDLTIKMYCR